MRHGTGRRPGNRPPSRFTKNAPHIYIPKLTEIYRWDEWMWKEMREGGYLQEYIRREKATSTRRQRAVARKLMHQLGGESRKPLPGTDLELKAAVPAREFFRWREVDPDFWADDANLKSLKRDNPDMSIFV